ncbi:hypothetical protein HH219_17520 [Pseudoalteromonas sp. NEC-BIFX-2020_015]|uniref:hypothetical protein n=1 Tax=Pseudoalteromonas sp. NEC-BIFX-2020_015 TaxID=2729544 RepID=UPI0014614DE1|nr:hypothetical protein [Pseudoalteromonas sp. NEC-BIFX-2020_015]NMR27312.1 hypothetical protein [Pseudoalteromonas sp. NEC-BIFX-2020_015]
MKILSATLLLFTFHSSVMAEQGVIVNILPDKLTLSISCEAQIRLQQLKTQPEIFSVGYSCKSATNTSYYMDFRLNDVDIVSDFEKGSTEVEVNKIKFNSYTLYEIAAKSKDGKALKFVSYCTKDICLDLVGDYEQSVKASITSQLRG